ncbi:MAG: DUF1501 domain-containing protein [Bacteroidota bacterium]|nr:DUF1501 domain-containing protein [Bacteroidota bacterium]
MKRRDFITRAVPFSVLPFALGGFSLKAYANSSLLEKLVNAATDTDRVLVLIQLNGGNDGLNMVIPLDQYSALSNARANILIDQAKVLTLTNATGLHPAMTGLQGLYNNGELAVVQSVGYPTPNFSHFRATDIWLTGADSNQVLTTGWMGRYLNEEFAGFPVNYPSTTMPDPLAIQIGSVVSPGLQGNAASMGMAIPNPQYFNYLVTGTPDPVPVGTPDRAAHELTFIRQVAQQTQTYAGVVKAAATKAKNLSTLYPAAGKNSLADQLRIVALLVAGGLKTRIYVVNLGGFDTHAQQVAATGGTETGNHATLLQKLSDAIAAFQDDLKLLAIDQRVVGMTFSEFGRRIKSNASFGTDHGAAAPLFLFGKGVKGGIVGTNPVIPPNATVNDNIAMQYDFRSVYASVLKDWFGVAQTELDTVLKTPQFPSVNTLPLISSVADVEQSNNVPTGFTLYQNYPNPFNPTTQIKFISDGSYVQLKVYDVVGREVRSLVDGQLSAGDHEVTFYADRLPSGVYYYRLQSGNKVITKKMQLLK